MISLITPAFNEGSNLPMLHERLTSVFRQLDWEWIIVDDHSRDNTFEVIERLVAIDPEYEEFVWRTTQDRTSRLRVA